MPTFGTLGKAVNKAQFKAFERAAVAAGLTRSQALDTAFKMFCEANGVEWPPTGQHGGNRKSKKVSGNNEN